MSLHVKDMGLDEAEFLRCLPQAFTGLEWRRDGRRAWTEGVEITWEPAPPRRIALLELPVLRVSLQAPEAFLRRFDHAFQRGGG